MKNQKNHDNKCIERDIEKQQQQVPKTLIIQSLSINSRRKHQTGEHGVPEENKTFQEKKSSALPKAHQTGMRI